MKDFLRVLLFAALFLGMFVFWASQCSAQSTFVRDQINTTRLTVLGSEKLFFSTDSTAPAAGYVKIWARDSVTLYLIRSSGVKVNLLASAVDTSVLATQYDISLKSVSFGTIDTSGLAVNKILKWNGSAWAVRNDSVGTGGAAADSTTWIATDYDVSLKLAKADTASLSSRINTKLTATDTASLSSRINLKLTATDTASLSDRINAKLSPADTLGLSTRINLKLTSSDTTGFRAYSNSLYLGQSLIDTSGKALGSVLKWNGAKWVDSTDNTGAGGSLAWSDTSGALATDYDVSLKLNSAAIDTSKVLFWADTTLSNGVATNYDLPVFKLDTVTAALDTLLVTVTSITGDPICSIAGSGLTPPIPVRGYRKSSTEYVIKFDYDLTSDQVVRTVYQR